MLRSLSTGSPVETLDLVLDEERSHSERPWVMLNMVSSLDGATAIGGRSTGLGDDDDREMFQAIRAAPDVILVGAATVAAENYRPVTLDEQRRRRRVAMGKTPTPTLAIVTGRLSVDPEARVFSDPEHKPLIITGTRANPSRLALLGDAADVAILDDLSPEGILRHLGAAGIVLLEGGPSLNGQFAGAGLLDEVNVTIASQVVSGESKRIMTGPEADPPLGMAVDRVLRGDRDLFVRFVRSGL
jgi:riboflavin biosynthesis pyrimidine reductase